jgi:hypothetical protein
VKPGASAWPALAIVVEHGGGAGDARWQWGCHRLVGRRINGGGSGEVRVLGCRSGTAPTRLEGAWGAVGVPPRPWVRGQAARDGHDRGGR